MFLWGLCGQPYFPLLWFQNRNRQKVLTTEGTEDHRGKSPNCDSHSYANGRRTSPTDPSGQSDTRQIVTAAMKVHSVLGPGLLESGYQACLLHEFRKQEVRVASQVGLPVIYEGEKIDLGYRIDLVVENQVIVEIKCVEAINPVHQTHCYHTCA